MAACLLIELNSAVRLGNKLSTCIVMLLACLRPAVPTKASAPMHLNADQLQLAFQTFCGLSIEFAGLCTGLYAGVLIAQQIAAMVRAAWTSMARCVKQPSLHVHLAAGLLLAANAGLARAQQQSQLPEASRQYVVAYDPLTQFRTERVPDGRMDMDLGILRAAYRLSPQMDPQATPEATARTWLELEGTRFGINSTQNLELTRDAGTQGVRHLTFQQTMAGIRVYGRFVQVSLGTNGLPVMAQSGYAPHLDEAQAIRSDPAIKGDQAEALASYAVSTQGAQTSRAELLVYPEEAPRLAWRIIAIPDDYAGEWEVLLDANTGQIIHLIDLQIRARPLSAPDSTGHAAKARASG